MLPEFNKMSRRQTAQPPRPIRWIGLRTARAAPVIAEDVVFVCYARDDANLIAPLIASGSDRGQRFWTDNQRLSVADAALAASESVLVICSRNSLASEDVCREVALAARLQKRIVALRLDDTPIPGAFLYHFSMRDIIDARDEDWRYKLSQTLQSRATEPALEPVTVQPTPVQFHPPEPEPMLRVEPAPPPALPTPAAPALQAAPADSRRSPLAVQRKEAFSFGLHACVVGFGAMMATSLLVLTGGPPSGAEMLAMFQHLETLVGLDTAATVGLASRASLHWAVPPGF